MSTRIYVCMHRPNNSVLSVKDPIYVPIQCGRAINGNFDNSPGFLPELGDNTGDNISNKNPYYSELTGTYWVWKNDNSQPDDIVGINHYRRYFSEPTIYSEEENDLLTEETIKMLLENNEFIVYGMGTDFGDINYIPSYDRTGCTPESAYSAYSGAHYIEDLDNALRCIKKVVPELYDQINYYVRYTGAMCLCNMMICRKKHFDDYCSFLFPVFRELEYYIDFDDPDHQGYNQRVFGFLGERLFRPWLLAKGYRAVQGRGLNWEKYSGYTWE